MRSSLLLLLLCGCLADGPVKIPYNDQPRDIGDGWPIDTPASQGIEPAALRAVYERFFSEHEYVPAQSLLVIRNGVLVAEGYCRDLGDRTRKNALQSAAKIVTSLAAGIAISQGILELERPIGEWLPQAAKLDERRRSITLHDMLTMRSGLYYPNDVFALEMQHDVDGDGLRHILRQPLRADPGTSFFFQDADPHLASGAIGHVAGRNLAAFSREHLFEPLGITDTVWLGDDDGVSWGSYGLYMRPRDFAKLGQLMLQKGRWNELQVVPEAWVDESIESHVDPKHEGLGFGYQWYPAESRHAYFAWGHGGQFLFVLPEKALVIVLTADPDTSGAGVAIEPEELFVLTDAIALAAR